MTTAWGSISSAAGGSLTPRAAYPAAPQPHGLLLSSDRTVSKKALARWATVEQYLSLTSVATGLVVFLLSSFFLKQFSEVTGQLLGGLLVASGSIGYYGGRRRSANLTNAQLLACLVGILLAFSHISEVVRDTQIDCALAELYMSGKKTQAAVADVAQREALQAVFQRLNQMEDSLTMVQTGAAKQVELQQEQQALKMNDLNYIKSKLEMVKGHAQELLDSVLKNPNITTDNIQRLSEDEKAVLRRRMQTADEVIDRISKHHQGTQDDQITFEEYQQILAALESSAGEEGAPAEVAQAKSELANFKAALERSKADSYGQLQIGSAPRQLQAISEYRRHQREKWNAEFQATLAKQEAKGTDFLVDLPAHCVKETAGERILVLSGLASIVLQVASAYVALSLSFRLPVGPKSA